MEDDGYSLLGLRPLKLCCSLLHLPCNLNHYIRPNLKEKYEYTILIDKLSEANTHLELTWSTIILMNSSSVGNLCFPLSTQNTLGWSICRASLITSLEPSLTAENTACLPAWRLWQENAETRPSLHRGVQRSPTTRPARNSWHCNITISRYVGLSITLKNSQHIYLWRAWHGNK